MAKRANRQLRKGRPTTAGDALQRLQRCALRPVPQRPLPAGISRDRLRLIQVLEAKWVNGTKLHYYFFEQPSAWAGKPAERDVVRKAWKQWKDLGIGLEFEEIDSPTEAEVRIGFLRGDGAWSYVGRDVLGQGTGERTMNFGWDLTRPGEIDTAIHEIGHTLGFPHEHQNPHAGIVWDEEAVYAALAQPPNSWDRETTFFNIIRKIDPDTVQGSSWDANSIMHYPFEPKMIRQPAQYFDAGLQPAGGLSERDAEWVKTFYPPLKKADFDDLVVGESMALDFKPGEQRNFRIEPLETRYFDIATFGEADTVMVLFEKDGAEYRYLTAHDDSGQDYNAKLRVKLMKGREYLLRLRLYYSSAAGNSALLMW